MGGESFPLPHCADRKITGGRYCKSVLQSGEAPLRDSMVGDFKHPRKYRITSPISSSPNTSNYWSSSSSNMSSYRPKLGFGRVDGSFSPRLHKPHSSGKPATSYCSKWGLTWLRAWGDNPSQWDSAVSIPRELKATTPQKIKVIKDSSTGRSADKYTEYPKFTINSRSRQEIKVINYKRYPIFAYQFRPRRSEERDKYTECPVSYTHLTLPTKRIV